MHQPTPPETLARILELARQTPRLTQTTIARRCGVTQSYVSRVCAEHGTARRSPRVDHRVIIELSRQKPRVTQAEIARRVGYNKSHVAKIIQAHNTNVQTSTKNVAAPSDQSLQAAAQNEQA